MPRWAGDLLAKLLLRLGPSGLEFGRYSIEYHWSAVCHLAVLVDHTTNLSCPATELHDMP